MTKSKVVFLRRKAIDLWTWVRNPQSAEGSSGVLNRQKNQVLFVDGFLALIGCIGLVEIRGCGLGKTKCNARNPFFAFNEKRNPTRRAEPLRTCPCPKN